MRKNTVKIALMLSGVIALGAQADFQYELSAAYSEIEFTSEFTPDPEIFSDFVFPLDTEGLVVVDPEIGNIFDTIEPEVVEGSGNGYLYAGSLFFAPVDDSKGPLSQADFLDKATSISVAYADFEDSESTAIFGHFVVTGDFIVEASYSDTDLDSVVSAGLGKYLTDTSSITLTYTAAEEANVDGFSASYRSLNSLSNGGYLGYSIGAEYVDSGADTGNGFSGRATYFGAPEWGIGLSASIASVGDIDSTEYGLHAEYFFNPSTAVRLNYSKLEDDGGFIDVENDVILLESSVRF